MSTAKAPFQLNSFENNQFQQQSIYIIFFLFLCFYWVLEKIGKDYTVLKPVVVKKLNLNQKLQHFQGQFQSEVQSFFIFKIKNNLKELCVGFNSIKFLIEVNGGRLLNTTKTP